MFLLHELLVHHMPVTLHQCCGSLAAGAMHPLSSEVIRACIPSGQVKPFPANCMSLMTVSGAKGSLVNFSQIACLLGQQVTRPKNSWVQFSRWLFSSYSSGFSLTLCCMLYFWGAKERVAVLTITLHANSLSMCTCTCNCNMCAFC